ncbi:hypothetical protein BAE44_0013608 [Dichanthelium oligosanthes]|uniref:Uncharacterized protein n=1 Tax=Dichanthelium oligosanthes TaxID=888268 RepID=A0A1E5VJR0_9POAL|nr:hypothetical protein BAE44_0013608 [Dichanthelium oligosanthes]
MLSSVELGGFRNEASAQAAADYPIIYAGSAVQGSTPAPHLSMDNIKGIVAFLQIQPEAVLAASLLEHDDDNDNIM